MSENTITVPREQLQSLLDRLAEYEKDEAQIAACTTQMMETLGITPQDLSQGNISVMDIISRVKDKISITDLFINKKQFEKDLLHNFGFMKELLSVIQNYANRKQQQQQLG
jgi:hypothetical protein